jgi:phage minor structural protein
MYKIYLDNTIFCDPRAEELAIIEPVVRLERNQPGEFTFTIPPTHERRGDIHERTSIFDVYSDDELIFSGVCMSLDTDFYNQIVVTCEGELGYFNDSIQRPARYQGLSVRQLLETYVANHNAQVDEFKRFEVGVVTVVDSNDYIYCYTNNNSTMTELKEDLIDDLGGYFHIRHENGVKYLDYLADDLGQCSQEIRLGENLLDYDSNLDLSNLATVIIPLGAKLEESTVEGLDTRLTIEGVNDGKDYIEGDAVKTYGRINQTVIFDSVTTAAALLLKGKKYLQDTQFADLTLTVKAIDLYWVDGSEKFQINKNVHVVSKAHGMDRYMTISKQTLNLWSPEKDELTLGVEEKKSLSARVASMYDDIIAAIESITPQSTILEAAKKNATALITSANGGYVYKTRNELYIMDDEDPAKAKKVWRWNINGLGYSSTGIDGTYGLAMTMDGAIVADFITSGTINASKVAVTNLNADNITAGTLKGRAINTTADNFYVTSGGYMHSADGDIGGLKISSSQLYSQSGSTNISALSVSSYSMSASSSMSAGASVSANSTVVNSSGTQSGGSTNSVLSSSGVGLVASGNDIKPVGSPTLGSRGNTWTEMYANYVWAGGTGLEVDGGNAHIGGNLSVDGTKNRIVDTPTYGKKLMYAYETATPYFGDIGSGTIGEDGKCYVAIDDVIAEAVETGATYQVFLQAYGAAQCYVTLMTPTYFVVEGTAGLVFGWEIKAVQKGYALERLETYEPIEPKITAEDVLKQYVAELDDSFEVNNYNADVSALAAECSPTPLMNELLDEIADNDVLATADELLAEAMA